ncbi:MAG: UDP-N-acetylmuramoyl-tripeptide--D-alanyl-D-alanine ligase [Planctomycetota bacterium]|jgi:UDP-N-acetylmuramoyl-tripeptide--D-alanyl-D-alanine ligase
MALGEIAAAVRGRTEGEGSGIRVSGAAIDSRRVKSGDLFFALPGTRTDGSRFVQDALDRGAAAAVVTFAANLDGQSVPPDRILRVADPARALWDLALWVRKSLNLPVVGITGSCGKTTTRELIHALLTAHLGPGHRSHASYNNHLGVPLTLLEIEKRHAFAVVEIGANRSGEIRALARLARPSVGVITNIRSAHLEGFRDLFGVAREKGELFKALPPHGLAVFNPAELGLATIVRRAGTACLTFGAGPKCTVRLERAEETPEGLSLRINGVEVRMALQGVRLAWNVLAALAVGVAFGIDPAEGAKALRDFRAPEGRLTQKRFSGVTILDDAYNANPASMKAALEAIRSRPAGNRRILILGDMLELGKSALPAHVDLGRHMAAVEPDLTISVGSLVPAAVGSMIARGIPPSRILQFEDTASF